MNVMAIDDDDIIRQILREAKTIAVVGASVRPLRDSNGIMRFLIDVGYRVFPVNPRYIEVLGIPCVQSLSSLPKGIDIVDVFRRSDAVGPIVEEAIANGAKTLWMQLGVVNDDAARKAEQAGLNVIMDHCIRVDHQRLIR
jgi:predicted CoA-binding protein